MTAPALSMKDLRRVVIAAAVGNVIEWYDFYIFGSLAALLSVKFFAQGVSGAALIKTVGTFTAGFLIRPFGAFVFGRIGDIVGRKYTFLITLSGMGLATALIGIVPSYAKIGALAGSTGVPSRTSRNMPRMRSGVTTPAGCRPRPRSGSSCPWWSSF